MIYSSWLSRGVHEQLAGKDSCWIVSDSAIEKQGVTRPLLAKHVGNLIHISHTGYAMMIPMYRSGIDITRHLGSSVFTGNPSQPSDHWPCSAAGRDPSSGKQTALTAAIDGGFNPGPPWVHDLKHIEKTLHFLLSSVTFLINPIPLSKWMFESGLEPILFF